MSIVNEDAKISILSQDLLIYMTYLAEAFNEIDESEEKSIIQEWLLLIFENQNEDIEDVYIRNMILSQMLMDIENNKLRFPFHERPSRRAHTEFVHWLKSRLHYKAPLENEDDTDSDVGKEPENRALDLDEFKDILSEDNRTYVAIRTLPNNGGVFGYVAITMGDGDDTQWLNCKGHPIQTPTPSNLPVEQVKGQFQILEPKRSDVKKVWMILKNRKPECSRNDSYSFYKTLYDNVEQEMLAEKINIKCTHPFINKLLECLKIDMKAIGVSDIKMFCRMKMLSILKKQIKAVLIEIGNRFETLETAIMVSRISPMVSLPPKCCYSFVSSNFWNELHQQRPSTKHMDILSHEYPQYLFPKYFEVLIEQKKEILTGVSRKYCKILDEMFDDLGNSISSNMKKYRDAKWEWHLVHEIFDAYNKEKSIKDSLCAIENSADETADSFLNVIYNEIEMTQNKLKSLTSKNDELKEKLPCLRNEVAERKHIYKTIIDQFDDDMDKLKKEINNEKRDMLKRENTIVELQRRAKEFK